VVRDDPGGVIAKIGVKLGVGNHLAVQHGIRLAVGAD
jgi:hypothetical protein